jgi:pilus assembly protein FimV
MIKSPSGVTVPNTAKRNRLKATVIAAAIAVLPLASHAAGLGKITVLSGLGQPLKAEIEVTANRDELPSLLAKVAAAESFRQAGIDYSPMLGTLRFSREVKERGGRRYLELSSDRPLNEPFIDMLVELSWASGRLVREYTFLLDPPGLVPKAAPAPVAAPEVRTEPAMAKPVEKPAATMPAESRPAPVVESRSPAALQPREKPAESAAGNSRTVVSGDTLGKIAAQTRPEGVSLDQMLVSLFRSNKDAFVGDNMNRLKAGKILSIPDAETASRVSAGEARQEIVAQAVDFNAYRNRLASSAAAAEPAKDQGAKQAVSGKIAPKVEDKAPQATGKDKLEVSRTEATRDAKGKPLQGRIASLEEDLVSRDRALKEAGSRIAELEKNLGDLKKLAEMKSQAGSDLQKQAQAAKPAPADAKKPDVPAPAPAPAAKPAEPPKPAEAVKPADAAPHAEPAKQPVDAVAAKPAEAAKPADAAKPPPAKKKVVAPPPPPEPDFIEENAPLVFGGGAVLALLFGWLGFSAYRKKRAAAAEANATIAEADLSAHSVFSTTSIAPPPSEQEASQFSSTGVGMAAHQETVDPVVEADTFLAFGRDAQAEEILLEALKIEPQRQAIHMKLLTIYAARKSVSRFESVAKELHALTGGEGTDWEKAAAMGAAIDPENSLYASAGLAEAPADVDMTSTTILRSPTVVLDQPPEVAAETGATTESAGLDFDLDIGTSAGGGDAATAAASVSSPEVAGLDFDLDLGAPADTPSADSTPQPSAASADVVLDIDFDMPAKESAAPALEVPAVVAVDPGGIDFDFDMGTSDSAAPAPLPEMSIETPSVASEPAPLDLGGISLELDTPAVSTASAGPGVADSADNPEVVTKLELAAAYAEMGDKDGARELYQEALAEGSPAQQKVARAKLDSLG